MSRAAFACLGALPALFFCAYFVEALAWGRAADSLWMCHVSNLVLAAGIIANRPRATALAVAWMVLGIPLCTFDMWQTGEVSIVSILSHLGGLAVGLYALSRVRLDYNPWWDALLLFLAIQQLCRWITPPALNVNLAHRAYQGWEQAFGGYGGYWTVTTLLAAVGLWGIGRVLLWWFPGGR